MGTPAWDREPPKGRVPLIQPRRSRIMGSSILASLSEAGGNDPLLSENGPLPPHSPNGADRVERDPAPLLLQTQCPIQWLPTILCVSIFQSLRSAAASLVVFLRFKAGLVRPALDFLPALPFFLNLGCHRTRPAP